MTPCGPNTGTTTRAVGSSRRCSGNTASLWLLADSHLPSSDLQQPRSALTMNRRITFSGIVCSALTVLVMCSSALATMRAQITAIIYVGRHFEVRDHDQPTKYVFNGATRVASITGSLSTDSRVQRLRLYPSWNLCSLAVGAANALQQFNSLSASGGEGEVVLSAFKWNPLTQGWLPVASNDNLAAGTVLWLEAKTNAVVSVAGSYSDPTTQQIQPGGVYIPSTGLEAWTPSLLQAFSAWFYD